MTMIAIKMMIQLSLIVLIRCDYLAHPVPGLKYVLNSHLTRDLDGSQVTIIADCIVLM